MPNGGKMIPGQSHKVVIWIFSRYQDSLACKENTLTSHFYSFSSFYEGEKGIIAYRLSVLYIPGDRYDVMRTLTCYQPL